MTASTLRSAIALLAATVALCACSTSNARIQSAQTPTDTQEAQEEQAMLVQFLEIVAADMEETCSALEKVHGVRFGPPVAAFGNARTAALQGGGKISVRAPMRADEHPVVRPYVLVQDIQAAVEAARAAGAEIAHPPLEIPGHGTFAIYILGGIQHGLWQL